MTGGPVRTVFLGSGPFAVPTLDAVASHPSTELVGVITAPPRPADRKQALRRTPVHESADVLGIDPILTPARLRSSDAIDEVRQLDADLLVLADYGRLVPDALLEPRYGALNLHPSLLPRHRGASPIPATILAGDPMTGVTLMRMDEGLDTGPIVAQSRWALDGDEAAPELEAALAVEAAGLLARSLEPWLAGELPATPQPEAGATLTRPLRRDDGRLDANRPVAELERQVRALQPWPGTFFDSVVGRVVVWRAEAVHGRVDGEDQTPGRIASAGVRTADGAYLALREVQPAGGRRMAWDEFVRGRPAILGSSIVA